jgi:2-phosphosulfolactate phosphatase
LSTGKTPTFCACLRNAPAVAKQVRQHGTRVAVIPAGEHWSDGSLRPSLEDLVGAGCVLAELSGSLSPEAELAVAAFERFRGSLHDALSRCSSGRELIEQGFAADVELACAWAVSSSVPIFLEDRFVNGA